MARPGQLFTSPGLQGGLEQRCQAGPSAVGLPALEQEPESSKGRNTLEPITAPPGEGGVRNPSPKNSGVRVPVMLTLVDTSRKQ